MHPQWKVSKPNRKGRAKRSSFLLSRVSFARPETFIWSPTPYNSLKKGSLSFEFIKILHCESSCMLAKPLVILLSTRRILEHASDKEHGRLIPQAT